MIGVSIGTVSHENHRAQSPRYAQRGNVLDYIQYDFTPIAPTSKDLGIIPRKSGGSG